MVHPCSSYDPKFPSHQNLLQAAKHAVADTVEHIGHKDPKSCHNEPHRVQWQVGQQLWENMSSQPQSPDAKLLLCSQSQLFPREDLHGTLCPTAASFGWHFLYIKLLSKKHRVQNFHELSFVQRDEDYFQCLAILWQWHAVRYRLDRLVLIPKHTCVVTYWLTS